MGASQVDQPVRVAVIEDHEIVIDGVRAWLAADPAGRAELIAAGSSIEEVMQGPGRSADVVVLDLELGTTMVTDRVAELSDAGFRAIVFSVHVEPLIVQAVMDSGACAFLDKGTERDRFVDTIVAVAHDDPVMTPSMAGGLLHAVHFSDREREVLRYLFQGMDHASIARRLRKPDGQPISPHTVKQYIQRARAKYAAAGRPCQSNFALLARCIEDGLIRPGDIADYRAGQAGR